MKLQHLLEEEPREIKLIAYTLQQELPDKFPHLITDVDIAKGKNVDVHRALSNEVYVLKVHGPLVSFYLDVSYQKNVGPNLEHTVKYRTDKDQPGDGAILMSEYEPSKITTDRISRRLVEKHAADISDMPRYNYLWFDKIAKHVETLGHKFFLKNLPTSDQVFTSQVIKKNERARCEVALVVDRDEFYITFGKFCGDNPKRVNDLGELTDIMNEVFDEQPN
jgi:hypothetical protein